jgi:PhnB protein
MHKKPILIKTIYIMVTVNPYLTFNGNCEEAFNFYKSVFGGEFPYLGRFKEMPPMDGQEVPESEGEKIMHVSLPISKETTLMGSDTSEAFGQAAKQGDNIAISINTDSEAEAEKLFNGLSEGGKVSMPLNKTFWGAYFGMFTDKFGIHWMVNYDYEQEDK